MGEVEGRGGLLRALGNPESFSEGKAALVAGQVSVPRRGLTMAGLGSLVADKLKFSAGCEFRQAPWSHAGSPHSCLAL